MERVATDSADGRGGGSATSARRREPGGFPATRPADPRRPPPQRKRGITFVQNASIDFISFGCGTRLL
jgi:hypothetical protein